MLFGKVRSREYFSLVVIEGLCMRYVEGGVGKGSGVYFG